MDQYYVDLRPHSKGEHEVHKNLCLYLPELREREYLGYYASSREAMSKARMIFPAVDGCKHCCPQRVTS